MSRRPSSDASLSPRLRRELRTVEVMIRMYCRAHHSTVRTQEPGGADLCPDCADLLRYSQGRIAGCRIGVEKPTCARCPVHCFRANEREQIRTVMRYAGPRMLIRHPYLATRHLLDGRRAAD